jgi:hypothetical protein
MSKITVLAEGQITPSDAIVVVLVEPADMPNSVVIHWPAKPTVCTPAQLDAVVAAAMRLLSAAVIELAALRMWKRL